MACNKMAYRQVTPSPAMQSSPRSSHWVGQGISAYDAGELWHYMDQRLGIALAMADKKDVGKVNFEKYNTLVLVDGSYSDLQDNAVKNGGLCQKEGES